MQACRSRHLARAPAFVPSIPKTARESLICNNSLLGGSNRFLPEFLGLTRPGTCTNRCAVKSNSFLVPQPARFLLGLLTLPDVELHVLCTKRLSTDWERLKAELLMRAPRREDLYGATQIALTLCSLAAQVPQRPGPGKKRTQKTRRQACCCKNHYYGHHAGNHRCRSLAARRSGH